VCCWDGFCIPNYQRENCIIDGGVPDCIERPCRDGCLIGDADGDGDWDLWDFGALQRCFSGPADPIGYVMPSTECLRWFDFDEDQDVDLDDYFAFHENAWYDD
jgi:hypothetical protein